MNSFLHNLRIFPPYLKYYWKLLLNQWFFLIVILRGVIISEVVCTTDLSVGFVITRHFNMDSFYDFAQSNKIWGQ